MGRYVMAFGEIDRTQLAVVGGKGAQLGELSRIEGIHVPAGFCVTTDACRKITAQAPSIDDRLDQLSRLSPDDREAIRALSGEVRATIEGIAVPDDVAAAITQRLTRLGEHGAYAVRSSATAEDLPAASFAGQHDTYLNVVGPAAVVEHVSRCWASLFTERAVIYCLRNRFDQRKVHMAVVVQQMVFPQAAGILFTADPVTSNRKVTSVEATFGLGEALVSGLVNPDVYQVRDGDVVAKTVGTKHLAIHASPAGGTLERPITSERREQPVLTDAQVLRLAQLGRRIEAHFGRPQDIEWCLVDDDFHIVQSRPITRLFPIPEADDQENHVYISVGHQQMMTDPMKPLGLSMWLLTTPAPMYEAGGRLFVDVTMRLASPEGRPQLLEMSGRSDPLIRDALQTIIDRGDFLPAPTGATSIEPLPASNQANQIEADPTIVTNLIAHNRASVDALKRDIRTKSGTELFDFILDDLHVLRQLLREGLEAIMAGVEATWWLNDHLAEWLGDKGAADTLTQSSPNNVTSEMGLALLDVADAIRPHPDVVAYLEHVFDDDFLAELEDLDGGAEAREAIEAYLDQYGIRCVGEIDITRPRWAEHPSALVPTIVSNIHNFETGEGARRFEQGRRAAADAERDILERLRTLPGGDRKAAETKRMIDRVRTFIGYREYPKYGMISRYYIYKQALLGEAQQLMGAGVLSDIDDVFYLTFDEFRDVVRTHDVDQELIARRKDAHRSHHALTPPRVLTSDGEAVTGSYRRTDLPSGALAGLPVSSGVIEGRARVITTMADADLEPGDILVTTHTDPSWSPLFVTITGLVTEVGGLMTHGAVVAREYGLPTVVGVEHATQQIQDGQRIRVNGTDGYVEIL